MPAIYQNGHWYGGKDSGHTIKSDGTQMNQRESLNFIDYALSDDSSNDATKIMPHELTTQELQEIIPNYSVPAVSGQRPLSGSKVSGPKVLSGSNAGFPVGTLISFLGLSVPSGYLLCDGSEYNKSDYLALSTHLLSLSTASAYEGTTNDTFKVPNLIDRFLKGSSVSGTYEQAGLPNITGKINHDWGPFATNYASSLGACYSITPSISNAGSNGGGGSDERAEFDASRSSAVYGRSNTVTPDNISMLYCIKY